jgi:hypothetical protein
MKKSVQRDATRLSIGVVLLFCYFFWLQHPQGELLSPVPTSPSYSHSVVFAAELSPKPTLAPDANQSVEASIKQVFGAHADKALKLLTCENGHLNPKAMNHNRDKDGNILSTDYGVFQINNKWQKVGNERFLFDPEINIRLAWRIYQDSGYTFKMWACGQKLKI